MALLKSTQIIERDSVRISLPKATISQVVNYCEFAEIKTMDEFFEQAACFVFSKDKSWKGHQATGEVSDDKGI